jgi:hypothetical protein
MMRNIALIPVLIFAFYSCTNDDHFTTVKGRVEREMTGEGIPNQKVTLWMKQNHPGVWSYSTEIDSKIVTTDSDGNFSVSMKTDSNVLVTVYTNGNGNYTEFQNTFTLEENIILKVNKFLKFKIYVNNTNPINANDYVHVDFFSGGKQSFRTKIENFGILNAHYPNDGGGIGDHEDTTWWGENVHSIVYYNVPENAEAHNIFWIKEKNSIKTDGITAEIPFQENQTNEYHFDY